MRLMADRAAGAVIGGVLMICTLAAVAAPAPSVVPKSWELKFRFQDPQRVAVAMPGQTEPAVYWYMLYSVENTSNREVEFYPRFDLVTDTLRVVTSEINVSPEAFQAIQRRSNDPLLVTPEKAIGKLRRGADQARHSVAVWRDFDPKARAFTVYISGLSGETARLKNPVFDPEKPADAANPRYFVLRKTLAVPYRFPGSESRRLEAVPERVTEQQKWIMR